MVIVSGKLNGVTDFDLSLRALCIANILLSCCIFLEKHVQQRKPFDTGMIPANDPRATCIQGRQQAEANAHLGRYYLNPRCPTSNRLASTSYPDRRTVAISPLIRSLATTLQNRRIWYCDVHSARHPHVTDLRSQLHTSANPSDRLDERRRCCTFDAAARRMK